MPQFTAQQLQDIAQSLNDISVQVGQIRLDAIHAGAPLNDPQIVHLLSLQLSLSNYASTFAVQAAQVTLDDTAQALNTIKASTDTAEDALDHLARIDKAINIASAVIVLATSIFTSDPGQIASAAKGVYDAATASNNDGDA